MSDLAFHLGDNPPGPLLPAKQASALLDVLSRPRRGFQPDLRFAIKVDCSPDATALENGADATPDPVADAYTQGFALGHEQATAQAAAQAAADDAARQKLALAFAHLDAVLAEQLRQRLRETVQALCEATLAPLAIDADALVRRVERAVSLLSRADDERTIRLHPDDIPIVCERVAADWSIEPDAGLERGSVRVETPQGGVEDGPAIWRLAITEALAP